MNEKKLNSVGLRIWLELNLELKEIGERQLSSYLFVLLLLLDCTLSEFSNGDNKKCIENYEHVLNHLKGYVHYLKDKYED